MNLKYAILALALSGSAPFMAAQVNSPQAAGYADRAAIMLADGNYTGCIDQCQTALKLGSPERERLTWLRCLASYKGGMTDARAGLTAFLSQFPNSVHHEEARFLLGSLTFFEGHWAEALKQFRGISRSALEANSADALDYRTAFCQLKLGNSAAADKLFQKLEKSKTYTNAARFYRGYLAYMKEDYPEAITLLESVDRSCEPGAKADFYLAQIRFKQGDYREALRLAEPLTAADATAGNEFRDEATRIAGEAYYALGQEKKALQLLKPYMASHADTAPLGVRYIVGLDEYSLGNNSEAIALLAPVTDLTDAMGQSAALTVGQAYLAEGNAAAAIMSFEKATHLDFEPAITEMAYYNYAVAQVDGGRIPFGSSVRTLEEFIKRYPRSNYAATVQDYLVKGYMATDDYDGALRSLNALKKETPRTREARQQVLFVLGCRALQSGNSQKAIELLTQADRLRDCNADIARQTTLWLADANYSLGKYGDAEKKYRDFLRQAPSADPNRATASYNLGYSLFGQRKYDSARTQFQIAEKQKSLPADARTDAHIRIADTYYYGSDFEAARRTYAEAYDMSPSTGDYALLQQAMMEGYLGKSNSKLELLDRMAELFPSSALCPSALTEKAVTLSALGKTSDAIATYETVSRTYPATQQGRNALLQLGILNRNARKTDEAIGFYKQVISRHPSSSEASLAVQDLKAIYADRGDIEELNNFLSAIEGAPQLDAVERAAIASAGLLKKANGSTEPQARLNYALQLLEHYPDSEPAEQAMLIAATAEFDLGMTERALTRFTELEQRASGATMRHSARMGILRSARDMGSNDVILETSDRIMKSAAAAGSDMPEVKFIRSGALADSNRHTEADALRRELARQPENLYGTRAAYELAASAKESGDLKEAQKEIESLIDANPPHAYWLARAYVLLSDILRAEGSDFEADEYLRVLRSNYPGNDADIFQMIDQRLQTSEKKK